MRRFLVLSVCVAILTGVAFGEEKTREQKVREDKDRVSRDGFWIYNDLPAAFEKARETGKPLLVALRCIPCEECVKLDDHLVDTDPVIRPLLEKFVCVRVVSTNGLDLSLFQYDTDQSFAMFMLNADRTIYGRFGTRSHRTEWLGDVSLKGLGKALQGALDLHAKYPANRDSLAGKTGAPLEFGSPEKYPALSDRFTDRLNYQGEVVKSCIHCHQIGDARRDYYRSKGQAIPEKLLYPFPHPRSQGLICDPQEMATLLDVTPDSVAARSGFQKGDRILSLNQQPLLSMADLQWVLNEADPDGAKLPAVVDRKGKTIELVLSLPRGWRASDDIDWRASSWGLRRMVTGGLKLAPVDDATRQRLKLSGDQMALKVEHVGQYGKHAVAKKSGFQKDDIIVSFDGQDDLTTSSKLLAYGATATRPGQRIAVTVLRNGKRMEKQLPMQD